MNENMTHIPYHKEMEVIESSIMDEVLAAREAFDYNNITTEDVLSALESDNCTPQQFQALLSPVASDYLEQMALKAKRITQAHFGSSVNLFTPLYIANYCENHCVYCGFNCMNKIERSKLTCSEMEREMEAISRSGLEEVLILTGESHTASDVEYIGQACRIARKYFRLVALEVYPMNSSDYEYLRGCGADYITVFQETYNPSKYKELHLKGRKRVFPYRFDTQERALMGGIRGVGFASLLGLDDFRKDAFATGLHASLVQRKYPHAEIALSCPRLRPTVSHKDEYNVVSERELLQVVLAYRIFLPYASITISTRERALFRDNIIGLAATKISAGVSTGVGEHSDDKQSSHQFEIADNRDVEEIREAIQSKGLQPVFNDYVYI